MARVNQVKQTGRVTYVEPAYSNSLERVSESGIEQYEMIQPMEDYSIFVNLQVEVRGRTIRINGGTEKNTYVMTWESDQKTSTVNFMSGSKIPVGDRKSGKFINALTTNYTNTFITDIQKKKNDGLIDDPTIEMFGISSIDVSYNNFMVPEVTIEFVDIRGVSLFAQEEYRHGNNGYSDETIAGSFFKCFFTFPYPKFTLFVKGFYGEPVSYELTCSDFRARFDSNTGNFGATAKFVGYAFSFLADVSLRAIMAAPYSDYIGAEYWNSKVSSGDFFLYDENGQKMNMIRFGELVSNIKEITEAADALAQSDPIIQEKDIVEDKNQKLVVLANKYKFYSDTVKAFVKNRFRKIPGTNMDGIVSITDVNGGSNLMSAVFLTDMKDYSDTFADFIEDNDGLIQSSYDALKNAIEEYNSSYNETLPIPPNMASERLRYVYVKGTNGAVGIDMREGKLGSILNSKNRDSDLNRTRLFNALKNYPAKKDGTVKYEDKISEMGGLCGFLFRDSTENAIPLQTFLSRVSNEVGVEISDINNKVDDAVDAAITSSLGFPPTIENMTRMLMAHFETFAYMVFKTGESICSNMQNRTMSNLGVGPEDLSDVSSVNMEKGNKNIRFVPPFPKVTHLIKNNGDETREDSWIGSYRGDFLEKDLIHGLINGTIEFSKKQELTSNNGVMTNSPVVPKTRMKIPLVPFDFVSTKDIYGNMGNFVNNDELAGELAQRAFGVLSVTNIKDGVDATKLGRLEAYNFYQQYPSPDGTLCAVINDSNFYNSLIDSLTVKSPSHPWGNDLFLTSTSKYDVFSLTNKKRYSIYGGTTKNGTSYLPLQALSSNKCADYKKTVFNSKVPNVYDNPDFIVNAANFNEAVICENVYAIEKNPTRFKTIIDRQFALNSDSVDLANVYKYATMDSDAINRFFDKPLFGDGEARKRIVGNFEEITDTIPKKGTQIFPNSISMQCEDGVFSDNKIDGNVNLDRKDDVGFDTYKNDLNTAAVTISEFFGIGNGGSIDEGDVSVFGQRMYYESNDMRERAFIFLKSLNPFFDYTDIFDDYLCSDDEDKQLLVLPQVAIMYAGALVWKQGDDIKNTKLKGMSNNFKRKLKRDFEKWANEEFGPKIDSQLAIAYDADHFDRLVPDIGSKKNLTFAFCENSDGKCGIDDCSVIDHFKHANASFFRNYISVGSSIRSDGDKSKFKGIKLINRPNGPGVVAAKNFILSFVGIAKNTNITTEYSLSEYDLVGFFKGFSDKLKELYTNATNESINNLQVERAKNPDDMTNDDIKISLYRYCKMIYDKWIGGLSAHDFDMEWTSKRFFGDNGFDKSKYFFFIDEYYSNANDIFLNVGEMCDMINNAWFQDDYTLLSYMYDIYAKNKFQFFCIQNFLDYGDKEKFAKMFTPIPTNSMQMPNRVSNFIAMYASEKSSNLDFGDDHEYKNDSFCVNTDNGIGGNKWPKALLSRDILAVNNLTIPAFGVSYGKLYQSYFQNISVGMDNPIVTEQALKAQFNIASANNEKGDSNPRSASMMGQDLFTVYSNNSYTCTIDMMGCAWVQPLMYFVLSNVPMFRGTYIIIKVTHKLEPGHMTTQFTGVRMSNVRTRKNTNWLQRKKANRVGGQGIDDILALQNQLADVNNNCPYPSYPIMAGDQNGGGIPESFLNMKFSKLRDMTPNRGNQKCNGGKMAPFFDKDITVEEALVVGLAAEYRGFKQNDYLMLKVAAALACNRYHYCAAKNDYTYLIGTCQMGTGNASATGTLYGEYKDKVIPILRQGPGVLVGLKTKVKDNCNVEIWNKGNKTNKKAPNTHTITLEDMQQIFSYCTMGGYDYEHIGKDKSKVGNQKLFEADDGIVWKQANFLFQEYNTVFTSNPDNPDKKYWQPAPKPLNDNKSKIKEYAMGFYNAVRLTSNNSSVGCEFGVSTEKSKGYYLYLTNGKNSNNFDQVFDIILNTEEYYEHVKELKWITNENSLKKQPTAIGVEISETPYTGVRKIGISFDDGATITSNKLKSTDINQTLCKSIVKKYPDAKKAVVEFAGIEDFDILYKNTKITECSTLVSSDSSYDNLGQGFAGTVTNPKMKKVLSMVDFLCHAHNYGKPSEWYIVRGYGSTGKVRESGKVKCGNSIITVTTPSKHGWCTFGPSTWYNAAGKDINFGGGPADRTYENDAIKNQGFVLVWNGTVEEALRLRNDQFRPGDIATEYYYKDNGAKSGHACMWTGSDWRSDFVQKTIMASTRYKGRCGNHSVCIWRHPDFQEPGLSVT